jgi:ABC-type sugar transport system ATPase subunit
VLGIAGLPGSGREELPYAIAGALGRDVHGEFRLASDKGAGTEEWTKASSARKLGIPLVPADRAREALFAEMSVNENLTLRILDRMGSVRLDRRKDASAAQSWVDRLGIKASSLTDPIAWLSGGNQQKIIVSRCLAEGSAVVVLCEPTAGVDIGSRIALYEFLAGEARKGLAVVVASSDIGDLLALCTRVLALRDGRCVAEIEGENLTELALLRAMEAREQELA